MEKMEKKEKKNKKKQKTQMNRSRKGEKLKNNKKKNRLCQFMSVYDVTWHDITRHKRAKIKKNEK